MPGEKLRDGTKTIGTQPDMWEFGTSRAAAWNCPVTLQVYVEKYRRHPRLADLMEVMRRWEDVRAQNWLTAEQKERLKSSTQEHHLYLNEKGEYELHEIEMLPTPEKAKAVRAFVFTRGGKTVLACWHTSGEGKLEIVLGADGKKAAVPISGIRYLESSLPLERVKAAYAASEMRKD